MKTVLIYCQYRQIDFRKNSFINATRYTVSDDNGHIINAFEGILILQGTAISPPSLVFDITFFMLFASISGNH